MPTLSDQLSVPDSPDLRDLLKAHNSRRRRRGGGGEGEGEVLTLASVLASEKRDMAAAAAASASAPGGRTLLDVLRDEEGVLDGSSGDGLRWRDFLRLRRAGAGAGAVSARSISARAAEILHPDSGTILEAIVSEYRPPAAAGAPPGDSAAGGVESADGGGSAGAATQEQAVRPSLMALLEQAEWQTGSEGGGGRVAPAAVGMEEGEGGMHMCWCCVCMVRQKGAAFIPCGHTFCRACSRELWVRRGSCPLCNAAVLDILDIY